jgi:hypothetical protein
MLPVAIRGTRRPPGSKRRLRPSVDVLIGEPFAAPPGKGPAAMTTATNRGATGWPRWSLSWTGSAAWTGQVRRDWRERDEQSGSWRRDLVR